MSRDSVTLDVRDDLRAGKEPMEKIMATVKQLKNGQSLRLLATFEPIPLLHVLGRMGFDHETRKVSAGDWEVLFRPTGERNVDPTPSERSRAEETAVGTSWPCPARSLDNRGLMPPEPMIRVLEALEVLPEGEVQEVFNDREPMLLYPELHKRGFAVRTEKQSGGVRLLIRHGAGASSNA